MFDRIIKIYEQYKPDYCIVHNKLYQSLEYLGLEGIRNTELRVKLYDLENVISKEDSILDLGSNIGCLDIYFSLFAKQVKCIESQYGNVVISNLIAKEMNADNIEFVCDDIGNYLRTTDDKFDVVFSGSVHSWCNLDMTDFVILVRTVLKDKGILLFESHVLEEDKEYDNYIKCFEQFGFMVERKELLQDETQGRRVFSILRKVR